MSFRNSHLWSFLWSERGSVALEAIWVAVFLAFFLAPAAFLMRLGQYTLEASWAQRTAGRNEAVNDNCSGFFVPSLNVTGSFKVNSETVVTCAKEDAEAAMQNQNDRFWKRIPQAAQAFPDFYRDMKDEDEISLIRGSSRLIFNKGFGLGNQSGIFDLFRLVRESDILVPDGNTWKFDKDHWMAGHDQRFWDALPTGSRVLFPEVFPSHK